MFQYYNPNPYADKVGDCVVRALSKALGSDWDTCYCSLCVQGYDMKDMPSANRVWGNLLSKKGFKRNICDEDCTVSEFCEDHAAGTYLLALQGHVVCCIDGDYYDSWDSGNEEVLYFWER